MNELRQAARRMRLASDKLRVYIGIGAHEEAIRGAAKEYLAATSDFGYAENQAQAVPKKGKP